MKGGDRRGRRGGGEKGKKKREKRREKRREKGKAGERRLGGEARDMHAQVWWRHALDWSPVTRFLIDFSACIHWENYISISFQIGWDMIVVTVFLLIF